MPRLIVRKGYRCQPGKRRELLAALQRLDAAAAEAGWPRGRYLLVETRSAGEPDVEVEFSFESYGEMEQLERRLREHLARAARQNGGAAAGAGQEFLLEPSTTRYLTQLDEAGHSRRAGQAPAGAAAGPPAHEAPAPTNRGTAPAPVGRPAPGGRGGPPVPAPLDDDDEGDDPPGDEFEEPPEPEVPPAPPDTPEQRRRQLAEARAALANAERAVNLPADQRAAGRSDGLESPPRRRPAAGGPASD